MPNESASLQHQQKIVVVMPALNEEGAIGETISELRKVLRPYNYEIVVVDGYSKDRTVERAKEQSAIVVYQMGSGYGDALSTGFLYGIGRLDATVFLVLDPDGTYDGNDAPKLIEPVVNGEADYVAGRRTYDANVMRAANRIGNWTISWTTRHLLKIPLHDSQTGMFCFRAYLVGETDFRTKGWAMNTEMLKLATEMGMIIKEVPVSYHPRIGKTKLGLVSGSLANAAVIVRMMRDMEPLLMFGCAAIFFVILGVLAGASVAIDWYRTGTGTHVGIAILSALSVIVGIQLMAFGLLSDMIKEVRRKSRPRQELFFRTA